jgi:hypothetical protein
MLIFLQELRFSHLWLWYSVSTFKDAVHLSPNDDYYLVTDSEGNIGNRRFFRPIPEPQVTEPELLQENKNDIVGNKILHCGKLMDMFDKFYKEHGQNEPRCELSCNWNTNNCQKWGLSWHLGLKCDNCNFCGAVVISGISRHRNRVGFIKATYFV